MAATTVGLPQASAEPDPRLEGAKYLFRQGVRLLDAGETESALKYFMRSRDVLPSSKNTVDAAVCLERLGRFDEALDLYDEVLTRFAADLDEEDRRNLEPVMAELRKRVGFLDLSSSISATVEIDGRFRATLPLRAPMRVVPGKREVLVTKGGYQAIRKTIEISAGQTLPLRLELQLLGTGSLAVESRSGEPLDVFVDGKRAGVTPWEGTLKSGAHVVRTERDGAGSAPEIVSVLEAKTARVVATARPLGPDLRLLTTPTKAEISIGFAPLGSGDWVGRLPLGRYQIVARADGYFDRARWLDVLAGTKPSVVQLVLDRDPSNPRWSRWHFESAASAGPLYAPTLHSGAERSCPALCAGARAAWGATAGLGARAMHASGLGAELFVGYFTLQHTFSRAVYDRYGEGSASYALRQHLDEHGPIAEFRFRALRKTKFGFYYLSALGVGALLSTQTTELSGTVHTTGAPVNARTSGKELQRGVEPVICASLGISRQFGPIMASAALGMLFFPIPGRQFAGPELGVTPNCPVGAARNAVGCAPNSNALAGETSHGSFWTIAPEIGASYRF
jgi:hypothetical protein